MNSYIEVFLLSPCPELTRGVAGVEDTKVVSPPHCPPKKEAGILRDICTRVR